MRSLFEFDLVQNSALGALAVHTAVLQTYESNNRVRGAALLPLMLVLPMAFHRDTREAIASRNLDGSFYKAVSEYRAMPAGLQHRIEAMQRLTYSAINLGSAAKLILRDENDPGISFIPKRLSAVPLKTSGEDVNRTLAAAKRIGHWIATVRIETLCAVLKVRF